MRTGPWLALFAAVLVAIIACACLVPAPEVPVPYVRPWYNGQYA